MKQILYFLAFTLYHCTLIAQESKIPLFIADSLENYITRGMSKWQIPGLSVAIVKDGKTLFIKGFGVTGVGKNEPVDKNTIFLIGSNTKTFTALAIAILQEEGKLSLEDKVIKWMPEFVLKDPMATKEATLSDLLSNRTGFETNQGGFTFWNSALTRADIIKKMGLMRASYGLRTRFGYNSVNFLAAGELIPRITGKSWEETVREKILIPLKMDRTLMRSEEFRMASNKAFPYSLLQNVRTEIPVMNLDNLGPAGSMSSSAWDMAIWLTAQLSGGIIDGQPKISGKAIQAIRRPYTICGMDTRAHQNTHFSLYGLGLQIWDRKGEVVYWHSGGVPGFASSVLFVPEENLGIAILTNNDFNLFFQDLRNEILDAFLGLPYQGYSDQSHKMLSRYFALSKANDDSLMNVVKMNLQPSLPLKAFCGKYSNETYGEIEIKSEKDKLNIYFSNHPLLIGRIEHIKNNSFLCTYSDPLYGMVEIPFKIENTGVIGFTLHPPAAVEFTPYYFVKGK